MMDTYFMPDIMVSSCVRTPVLTLLGNRRALTTDINRECMATYARQKAVTKRAKLKLCLHILEERVKLLVGYCCDTHPKLSNPSSWTKF